MYKSRRVAQLFVHFMIYIYIYILSRVLVNFPVFCLFQRDFSQKRLYSCRFSLNSNEFTRFSPVSTSFRAEFSKSRSIFHNSRRNRSDFIGTVTVKTKIRFVGVLPTQFRRRTSRFSFSRNGCAPLLHYLQANYHNALF